MKELEIINWMKKHSQEYSVVLGVDGYVRSKDFDEYFTKHFMNFFKKRIALIVTILLSGEDATIYLSDKKYNFHKEGLEKLVKVIDKILVTPGKTMDILFTRRITDDIEYPDFERTYQYLLSINNLTDTKFYNIPNHRKKYVAGLVNKMNLSLVSG